MHLTTLQVLHVQTPVSAKKFLGMKVTVTTTQQTLQVSVAAKITTTWLTPTAVRVAQVSKLRLIADNWVNINSSWYLIVDV